MVSDRPASRGRAKFCRQPQGMLTAITIPRPETTAVLRISLHFRLDYIAN